MAVRTVSFAGAGNVASNIARALSGKVEIRQIWSRNPENAVSLVRQLGLDPASAVVGSPAEFSPDVDLLICSVTDDSYPALYASIPRINGIVVNTSGSAPWNFSPDCPSGCFYPMQTFKKEKQADFSSVPIMIEGQTPEIRSELMELASRLSDKIMEITSPELKMKIHIAAIFASNFPVYLWRLSAAIMDEAGGDFSFMESLIRESLANSLAMSPEKALTGPASRGDEFTIARHIGEISRMNLPSPSSAEIYSLISNSIMQNK